MQHSLSNVCCSTFLRGFLFPDTRRTFDRAQRILIDTDKHPAIVFPTQAFRNIKRMLFGCRWGCRESPAQRNEEFP